MQSELIGYVRKSRSGNALNISLSAEALDSAQRYLSADGKEYIGLVVNAAMVQEIHSLYQILLKHYIWRSPHLHCLIYYEILMNEIK